MVEPRVRPPVAMASLVLSATLVAGFIPFYIFTTAGILNGDAPIPFLLFVLLYGALALTALVLSLIDLLRYKRRRPLPVLGCVLSSVALILLGGLLLRLYAW